MLSTKSNHAVHAKEQIYTCKVRDGPTRGVERSGSERCTKGLSRSLVLTSESNTRERQKVTRHVHTAGRPGPRRDCSPCVFRSRCRYERSIRPSLPAATSAQKAREARPGSVDEKPHSPCSGHILRRSVGSSRSNSEAQFDVSRGIPSEQIGRRGVEQIPMSYCLDTLGDRTNLARCAWIRGCCCRRGRFQGLQARK